MVYVCLCWFLCFLHLQCIEIYIIYESYIATSYTSTRCQWYFAKIDTVQKKVQYYWSDDNRHQCYQIATMTDCCSGFSANCYAQLVMDGGTASFYGGIGGLTLKMTSLCFLPSAVNNNDRHICYHQTNKL